MKKILRKNEEALRELQENIKYNNIYIMGIPEREGDEKWIDKLVEKVMMEKFLNSMREKVTQVQEAQKVSIKMNSKRPQDTS